MYYYQKQCRKCKKVYWRKEITKSHFEMVSDNPALTYSMENDDSMLTLMSDCGCLESCIFCGSSLGFEEDPRGSGWPACKNCGGV